MPRIKPIPQKFIDGVSKFTIKLNNSGYLIPPPKRHWCEKVLTSMNEWNSKNNYITHRQVEVVTDVVNIIKKYTSKNALETIKQTK